MASAATSIITALATGLLTTAGPSVSSDGPSPERAPQARPYVQTSSTVSLGEIATPNGLIAVAAELPAVDSFIQTSDAPDFIPGTGAALASERKLFAATLIQSADAVTTTHRSPVRSFAAPALRTGDGGIGNSAAVPSAAGAGSVGAFIAIFISNGTPEHPDAGLLIGNGADLGPGQDGGDGGLLFGHGGRGGDGVATVNGGTAGDGGNAGLIGNGGEAAMAATSPQRTTLPHLVVTAVTAVTAAGCWATAATAASAATPKTSTEVELSAAPVATAAEPVGSARAATAAMAELPWPAPALRGEARVAPAAAPSWRAGAATAAAVAVPTAIRATPSAATAAPLAKVG